MLDAISVQLKNKLFRYALRIVQNRMEAEDIVQEVMVKVWKKNDELKAIGNFEAWCMTVTRNLALDKLRKVKKTLEPVEHHIQIKDKELNPYQKTRQKEIYDIIQMTMNKLSDDQKQVIHLRDIEGYTYKEIAQITEFSIDKIKVYLHRARINLRKALMIYRHELEG
ncbi:MAG: sigma-70 family RNA polymerase sigma factor [Saprospiraceae bacterium]